MADLTRDIPKTRQCPICSEVVVNKKVHINMHYGMNYNYQCPHCGKVFAHQENLRMHECVNTIQDESVLTPLHSKRREYQCPVCPKTFQFSSRFMEHAAVHTKEHRYTCLYCPKTFKTVYSVWDHLVNNHSKLTDDTAQVNKMNMPKSEIKSSLRQKTTQTMKVKGYHREIRFRLPASIKNVNLHPKVVLSRSLTEVLSKMEI